MLLSLKEGGAGRGSTWNETSFKMGVLKLLIVSKHCLTDKYDRPQLEMLKHTKKFFPKEKSLLNYVRWNMFLSVLGKGGGRTWARLGDSTCLQRPESPSGKINKLEL